ncbi:hypothetical protein [Clostridium sp. OS1-26]|uniref:hypothetical protein n=1 Tax=Clostridium sp. OS1-26 TaxID=3070681 RepID=UPI0027DEADF8|nr:hypothetical protein [Clostridium sp. OS1-26]WML35936.1 hypothetical protein RCG18_04095 [Clostridium sp. OS1-26]
MPHICLLVTALYYKIQGRNKYTGKLILNDILPSVYLEYRYLLYQPDTGLTIKILNEKPQTIADNRNSQEGYEVQFNIAIDSVAEDGTLHSSYD